MKYNNVNEVARLFKMGKDVGQLWLAYGSLQAMAATGDELAEAAMSELVGTASSADHELLLANSIC